MICNLVSIYLIALNLAYNKNKPYKTLDYWSRDTLSFDFLEKGLGIVSPPHFVHDFSWKMFLTLYDQLSLSACFYFFEILGNMCNAIVCFPDCDAIDFEINLTSNQAMFLHDQKSRQKLKYLENKKSF